MTANRDIAALEAAILEDMSATYDLVYVDRGDGFSPEQVAMIVRGDMEALYESTDEWSNESAWYSACDIADGLAGDVIRRWEREDDADYSELRDYWEGETDPRQSIIDTIRERDDSEYLKTLARMSGGVLLRIPIPAMDEDAGLSLRAVEAPEFLALLGWEHTQDNLSKATDLILNTPSDIHMGYVLAAVDVEDVYDMPYYSTDPDADDYDVVIHNPHVMFGNPFTGATWVEGPFTGDFVCKRSELRTDEDAFGYSWTETAGPVVSAYQADIAMVPVETANKGE